MCEIIAVTLFVLSSSRLLKKQLIFTSGYSSVQNAQLVSYQVNFKEKGKKEKICRIECYLHRKDTIELYHKILGGIL